QALSLTVHLPLVFFGLAFPSMVLFAESRYLRTGDQLYRTIAQRWSKVMLTLFAVGVVTGTILSFEFGVLWPNFIGTFGNVFGLGFALEGFSFFLEAIFIGIYVYGWNRLSPRIHFLSGIPVVIAGVTGATFVIAVNAWMNHPSGFRIEHGKAVDVHPWAALFGNSFLWQELVHMYLAAYIVVGFLVAGWYAWCFLHGRFRRYERAALAIPLAAAALASPVEVVVGDWAARAVAKAQPVKLAAMEGLGHTTRGAPEHLLGIYQNGRVKYGIEIPHLLSLLADHSWNGVIKGLNTVAARDRPPVNVVRFSFQTMAGIGTLLALLAVLYVIWRVWHRRLPSSRWFYRAIIAAGPLALVAAVAGWITTEVGRQPWIVYGVMRTSQAVTGAKGVPVGYVTLAVVYVALAAAVAWVLRRISRVRLPVSEPEHARAA
ncbi:MAG: cytochrome bd ubiquinol oxidase subunit, partial [Mycobacterium sp.]|nr:cytochrome bd ubiquinol oxidase subunit [Mycobacterium sp.]